ncbi:sulfotransferase family 2 domain-containing protein [Ascidiaceihabitans sp.]|uniref:sulfotransferase family 2 domain-containing protein n=1 Tax=Ascidiaceihabitans sp. TaxID=1872644 RepID=UPI003298A2FC
MTLVSHDHKFILLRTRKTASTSVEMFLQPFCTPPNTPVVEVSRSIVSPHGIVGQRLGKERHTMPVEEGEIRDVWFSHQNADSLKKLLGKRVWSNYQKISIVRNPFEKVRSAFIWTMRARLQDLTDEQKIARFRKKVRAGKFKNDAEVVFTGLKTGKKPKFEPDILLKTENIANDLLDLCKTLKLDPSGTELPITKQIVKKSKAIPLADWYDDETIDSVRRDFSWIFEHGGYPDAPT